MRWPSKDPADYYPPAKDEPAGSGEPPELGPTRTQVFCTTVAILACEIAARLAGLDFGELLTHLIAGVAGGALGRLVARRLEPPSAAAA